jgi:nucleotide-binding universal stress UspA family protein
MKILVYTDGSDQAEEAASLLRSLGAATGAEVTILGVSEMSADNPAVEQSADRIEQDLEQEGSEVKTVLKSGEPTNELVDEAKRGSYDLVIVARTPKRRPARLALRSTTKQLAKNVPAHLLITRNVPDKLRRILICTGAEEPSEDTIKLAGLLTAGSGAEVFLLHVMSQVALRADSHAEDLEETAEQAMDHHTPEGDHLAHAVETLRQLGVESDITPLIRHGLVVDEVLTEIKEGDYDLLVLGSHRQPTMTRWMDVLLEDVAGELLRKAPISTLVIHQQTQLDSATEK